ncbi:hypothetical protein [Thiolapillus brandeum]|uniref:Outer membrane protein beta-barrel domain-containing protein n=1 Tax=Thiolapillus brandeum TaxID=1076588 RepID=A0A7U6GK18_9GAMM|nr:hypothetical protein [Thiolapillus brandeum]BAO45090.1 conserved hypothetical protein [Thiolapillus brandeum]
MIDRKYPLSGLAMLLASGCSLAQAGDTGWATELDIYMLGANIKGDSSMGRITGAPVDIDFGDILETLKMSFMGRVETMYDNRWGFWLDYAFMDLADKKTNARGGVVKAGLRQGVMEAMGVYRQPLTRGHVDYYAGIRWWDNDIDATVNPALLPGSREASISEDWVDPLVGARWTHVFNKRWSMTLRGDVGGFGIASDITWAAAIGARYRINDSLDLDMQYKGTWVDYSNDKKGKPEYFQYDTVTHGPLLGLVFRF